jgi:hypothetical protein
VKKLFPLVPAAAGLFLFGACAARRPAYAPATAPQAASVLETWARYRAGSLPAAPAELFYDAEVSRRGLSISGTVAVRDDPGKSLSLLVEGPLGLPVARAVWDGSTTRVTRYSSGGKEKRSAGDSPELGESLGIPLSARSLSYLFFGLPEEAPPDTLQVAGSDARLVWLGGDMACEFDVRGGRARRVLVRGPRKTVEVAYLDWSGSLPSRIRVRVSSGGTAELTLRPPEPAGP